MLRTLRKLVALALALSLTSGCVSFWNQFPSAGPPSGPPLDRPLYYDDGGVKAMFSGASALKTAFRNGAPFRAVEARQEVPAQGEFVRIEAKRIAPHAGSAVIGYFSYFFLLLIPFWSTEGYTMRYQVYVDGEERRIFEYDITRKTFFWLPAFAVSWVTLLLPSESEAFEATAHQFFKDSAPYFRGDRDWP